MPPSDDTRRHELGRYKQILNTENGQALVVELETIWDSFGILGETAEGTAYNCGLRDAFKFIKQLQDGDLIHDGD